MIVILKSEPRNLAAQLSSSDRRSAAGAVAGGSSTYPNGDCKGTNCGSGGGWADGTRDVWPDALKVAFAGPRTISEITVYTLQDEYQSPAEPTEG